ncbi:hypothetical protein EVAR_76109_1 [Eumeta japonica]|uniref:Uncharacterized protein n=1 Tax=Eumeta variegata TaxID=151549 RepID=A0A4C1W421_EUMVA|nr:hypothetical protein EVAR_76109_1 [Eumeta japonica]
MQNARCKVRSRTKVTKKRPPWAGAAYIIQSKFSNLTPASDGGPRASTASTFAPRCVGDYHEKTALASPLTNLRITSWHQLARRRFEFRSNDELPPVHVHDEFGALASYRCLSASKSASRSVSAMVMSRMTLKLPSVVAVEVRPQANRQLDLRAERTDVMRPR